MTPEELTDVMAAIEHLWPASTFRNLDEIDTWRRHLEPLDANVVARSLGALAGSGEHKRFRPDLPLVLSAVGERLSADRPPEPPDVGWKVGPPTAAEKTRGLAAIREIRARLGRPA
jgi:hypothetical protein